MSVFPFDTQQINEDARDVIMTALLATDRRGYSNDPAGNGFYVLAVLSGATNMVLQDSIPPDPGDKDDIPEEYRPNNILQFRSKRAS